MWGPTIVSLTLCVTILFCRRKSRATDTSSDNAKQLSVANARFTADLFDQIRKKPGNLFFSPIGVETLLAMAQAGAEANTATQIQKTAYLPENPEKSATVYGGLMDKLKTDSNIMFKTANGLYIDKGFTIKRKYLDIIEQKFKAKAGQVEFGKNTEAAKTINSYVAKGTGNKIMKVFDSDAFNEATKLVFLDAIYFKPDWKTEFNKQQTRKEIFHVSQQEQKEVDFMHTTQKFDFDDNEHLDAKILRLPFKDDASSMVLVLPNQQDGLADLETKIAKYDLTTLTKSLFNIEVMLSIPKFKLEDKTELNDLLIKLGTEDLFSETKANLSRIASKPVFVNKAVEKVFIEVDEKGAEVAAATAIIMPNPSNAPRPKIEFRADRPFLFFIQHLPTNVFLFMGRFASP